MNDNDLISRTAALDAIDSIKPMHGNMEQLAMKVLCWAAVKTIQPVDAVPVVSVHYVKGSVGEWYCSNCKRIDEKYSVARYCWYCGARMDGERRDDNG